MEIKGTAIVTIPIFVEEKFGKDGFDKWINLLTPDARKTFTQGVYPAFWYPIKEILVEPTQIICDLFYNGDQHGAWECGQFSAENALRGVYAIFIKLGSPAFLIKSSKLVLEKYFRPVETRILQEGPNKSSMELKFPESYDIMELRIGGWIQSALEISGCKSPLVEIKQSIVSGDPAVIYKATWE